MDTRMGAINIANKNKTIVRGKKTIMFSHE